VPNCPPATADYDGYRREGQRYPLTNETSLWAQSEVSQVNSVQTATRSNGEQEPMSTAQRQYVLKICVVGEGAVGKTSLIIRYTEGHFRESYLMTIGTGFAVKELDLGDTLVRLQLWDLAGQPHFSSVRPVFYRGAAGLILVFDVTRRETFDKVPTWYEEVQQVTGDLTGVLLANKVDMLDQRRVTAEEGQALARQRGWTYFETSAKDGKGVADAFRQIATQAIDRGRSR